MVLFGIAYNVLIGFFVNEFALGILKFFYILATLAKVITPFLSDLFDLIADLALCLVCSKHLTGSYQLRTTI
jgi:hypothetical protein